MHTPDSPLHEFPRSYQAIVHFLRRRMGNIEDAREVAHEAWLRLAERQLERPAEPAQASSASACAAAVDPRAYLYAVAANLGTDRQRRAQWLQGHLSQRSETGAGASHEPDVAEGLMYRPALAAIDAALAALPERAREVFIAHRVHDERQADIASRLGVSLNTVERDLIGANDRVEAALRRWRGEDARHGGVSKGRRTKLASLLGLGGLGLLGAAGGWQRWRHEALRWQAALAAPHGQRLRQSLPDGSTLTLDARSRVELAFDARRRAVRLLQGAAFFDVNGDAGRPFVVDAGAVTVTVLGTRFGVEVGAGGVVLVQVEHGRVQVAQGDRTERLVAGQGLQLTPDGAARAVAGPAATWREGRLRFEGVSLGDAVDRLSSYASFPLRVDGRAAQLRVSGTVEIARMADWLSALPAALPVRLVREADGGVLLAAR